MCLCGAVQKSRCICDQMGWTVVVRPENAPVTSRSAEWFGWTQSTATSNQRLRSMRRPPSGYKVSSHQVTFEAWCIQQGPKWIKRRGRPAKTIYGLSSGEQTAA